MRLNTMSFERVVEVVEGDVRTQGIESKRSTRHPGSTESVLVSKEMYTKGKEPTKKEDTESVPLHTLRSEVLGGTLCL